MGTCTFLMRFPYQLILLSSTATYHCLVVNKQQLSRCYSQLSMNPDLLHHNLTVDHFIP